MTAPGGHPASLAKNFWIPALQTVAQLAKRQMLLFCHSGLDPESSSVSGAYVSGCRIKSGMTVAK
jgi:ketopantoate hydroxymethyltransferase